MEVFPDNSSKSHFKSKPSVSPDATNLADRLCQWATTHNWDQVTACTHQLIFAKEFVSQIHPIAWEKEMSGKTLLPGQIAYATKRIHNLCDNIDRLVRIGCRTEEELEELEASKAKVKSAILELSVLVAQCSDVPKKRKASSQNGRPRVNSNLSKQEQCIWAMVHVLLVPAGLRLCGT